MSPALPFLAEIELDFGQLVFVLVLVASGLKSLVDARKKKAEEEQRRSRRRSRPVGSGEEFELPFPVPVPVERRPAPEPRPEARFEAEASAPSRSDEPRAALGLDLDDVEDSLPSRDEAEFESHARTGEASEGRAEYVAMHQHSDRARLRRPRRRSKRVRELRRAIIMAEVLGRPVALRGDLLSHDRPS